MIKKVMNLTEFTEKHKHITALGIASIGILLIVSSFITFFFPIFGVVCISGSALGFGILILAIAYTMAKTKK